MTLKVWALSLMGSTLAKMPKEKNTNISMVEIFISPLMHRRKAESASATEPAFNTNRCMQFAGTKPHSIFRWIFLLSSIALFMASMEAPSCPKDFTMVRPLAYSMAAAVRSRFASASTGAFFAE